MHRKMYACRERGDIILFDIFRFCSSFFNVKNYYNIAGNRLISGNPLHIQLLIHDLFPALYLQNVKLKKKLSKTKHGLYAFSLNIMNIYIK